MTLDRHCAIGRVMAKQRRHGNFLGLGYPFVSWEWSIATWVIWNYHTGIVAAVIYSRFPEYARRIAAETLEALNGCWEHDRAVNVLHDMEA